MNRRLLTLLLCSMLLSACGNVDEPVFVPTNKADFSKFDLGDKEQIQSKDSTFKTKILNFINSNNTVEATAIECTGDNRVRLANDKFPTGYGNAQALIIASQDYEANVTVTFASKLKSVTVKAQQYYNLVHGYEGDTHIYPYYDSQKWDDELSDNVPDDPTFEVNGKIMTSIVNIGYVYDDDGYTLPNVPQIYEQKFEIDSTTLSLTAYESQRVRIYEISFEFESEK